jgi:hypothetical protein
MVGLLDYRAAIIDGSGVAGDPVRSPGRGDGKGNQARLPRPPVYLPAALASCTP